MCKKYYLRDEELHSVDDDFFVINRRGSIQLHGHIHGDESYNLHTCSNLVLKSKWL